MAVADAAPYDMICMDLRLPAMDGVEAVRQIREAEAGNGVPWSNRVKIIMETSVDDLKNVMRSFHELCDAYLVKPIKKASLLEEMRKMGMTA
jgi:two-component system chemotaxis response regulator CheY